MNKPPKLSREETEQILQTIEMFEAITQANAGDCQSLEILKDAHWRLGQEKQALDTMRRLGESYMAQAQTNAAMREFEGILEKEPENAEVRALLGELRTKVPHPHQGTETEEQFSTKALDPDLIKTSSTRDVAQQSRPAESVPANDGNEALAKFLLQHRLAPEEAVNAALEATHEINKNLKGHALAASLIDEIAKSKEVGVESILCGILDRTKFAYVPLENYDIDRQIVKMLPESLTMGRLIVPFDLVSRTVMIAMANPFDARGKEAVQQLFDYNIQWHLAAPAAIIKVLSDTYRLDARD